MRGYLSLVVIDRGVVVLGELISYRVVVPWVGVSGVFVLDPNIYFNNVYHGTRCDYVRDIIYWIWLE